MADHFDIRAMVPADIDAAARLRFDAFFDGTPRTAEEDAADLARLVASSERECALVAVENGRIVGACLLIPSELEQAHDVAPWLAGLVVAPDRQGHGLGQALVRAIESAAGDFGFDEIFLYTFEAEHFYERLGWQAIDRFADSYGPSILMRRALGSARTIS